LRLLSIRVHPGIATLAVTLCFCLVLGEIVVRLFLYQIFPKYPPVGRPESMGYEYDSTLGWFPPSKGRKTTDFAFRAVSLVNNSYGLRDVEPAIDSRPGVLFLGDSFVWGSTVEADERFTEKLRGKHPE